MGNYNCTFKQKLTISFTSFRCIEKTLGTWKGHGKGILSSQKGKTTSDNKNLGLGRKSQMGIRLNHCPVAGRLANLIELHLEFNECEYGPAVL